MGARCPAGLLLDFDGTLADTLSSLKSIYRTFLEERNSAPSDAEFDELNGVTLPQAIAVLRTRHGWDPSEAELLAAYQARVRDLYPGTQPARGARELLAFARAQRMPVAVVTSGRRDEIAPWLERHGLLDDVAAIVGGDDVTRGKPDPEPYHAAARALGVRAGDCAAIEDSPIGARAALAAGAAVLLLAPATLEGATPCADLGDALAWLRRRCSG